MISTLSSGGFVFRELVRYLRRRDLKAIWNRILSKSMLKRVAGRVVHPRADNGVEVHLLCGNKQWSMALWMMCSFNNATATNWEFVIHDDGTFNPTDLLFAQDLGLRVCLMHRLDADALCFEKLLDFPFCAQHRRVSAMSLKFYDPFIISESNRYIVLDTDLLFFERPFELLQWVERCRSGLTCMLDVSDASQIDHAESESLFGIKLKSRVNAGICLVEKSDITLAAAEEFLSCGRLLEKNLWMVEQTLYALFLSRSPIGCLLSATYELSLGRDAAQGCVMRHYVGAVRNRFYSEGIPRVMRNMRHNTQQKQAIS